CSRACRWNCRLAGSLMFGAESRRFPPGHPNECWNRCISRGTGRIATASDASHRTIVCAGGDWLRKTLGLSIAAEELPFGLQSQVVRCVLAIIQPSAPRETGCLERQPVFLGSRTDEEAKDMVRE